MATETKLDYAKMAEKTSWESMPVDEVFDSFQISEDGASQEEAEKRLGFFGENKLPEGKKKSKILKFLLQFNNALIYVLIVAAIITGVMQHWIDMGVILGVIIINAVIGHIQEGKAEKALDSIRKMLSASATVMRDGKKKDIDARFLVPGDLVFLKAGDKVPADIRLVDVSNLRVEEASLTGEAEEVLKYLDPVEENADLGDRTSMVYMGTSIRNGAAIGIVVATAEHTELGKINTLMTDTKETTTPLIKKINQFGLYLSIAIVGASVLIFLYGYLIRDMSASDIFLAVIGIAVAAIPEGLPAIMTITLAIGVQKMAGRNAIVRKLPSVETLGSVSVICSDKTGTLTRNEMSVVSVFTSNNKYDVEGTGYSPEGRILLNGEEIGLEKEEALLKLIESAGLCNDSEVNKNGDDWELVGAPTEGALKAFEMKGNKGSELTPVNRIASIPFDSNYKYMSTLNQIGDERYIFINGAPEKILALCESQLAGSEVVPIEIEKWTQNIEAGASLGQRMLASAYLKVSDTKDEIEHADLQNGLVFLGLFGVIDPPREEAVVAVRRCKEAGITVKMITGDHALTAMSIGKELGIGDGKVSLVGSQIEKMTDEELKDRVRDCHIFARTTPEHKLRIVKAIQANNDVCAMTGDGVNDAPALKRADMGIAMGIKGTEVSKDASDMILVDDNFASIVHAVEEGRTIYDNLRKTLLFILPTNGAEALSIVIAIFIGAIMPITPPQILWVNMITAVTLGLSLSFEPMEENAMKRPPRNQNEPIINAYFGFRIFLVSMFVGIVTLLAFLYSYDLGGSIEHARTIAVNTLVLGEMFYLFNCKKIGEPAIGKGFFDNKVVVWVTLILIVFQLIFTYAPFMNVLFKTAPLTLTDWIIPILGGIGVFALVEIEKLIVRKVFSSK